MLGDVAALSDDGAVGDGETAVDVTKDQAVEQRVADLDFGEAACVLQSKADVDGSDSEDWHWTQKLDVVGGDKLEELQRRTMVVEEH